MTTETDDIAQIATIQTEVKSLTEAVRALTASMQKNNERLERLAVLEALHTNSNHAIERAFQAIEKIEELGALRIAENEKAHKNYDRTIWVMTGFCLAVSIFWTVFGIRVSNTLEETMKSNTELKLHLGQDKIMSEIDVFQIHKNMPAP